MVLCAQSSPLLEILSQGWCPAVQPHSSCWLHQEKWGPQPPEQQEALIITASTFNFFLFQILHEHLFKNKDHETLPWQILMHKLLKVFSPFSLHKVPYVIFASLPSKKRQSGDPLEERGENWKSVSILTAHKKIKSEICKIAAPWFLSCCSFGWPLLLGVDYIPLLSFAVAAMSEYGTWLSWLGTCRLIYENLQTHKTRRFLLFTHVLNVPFTFHWINLEKVKIYF